MFVPVPLTPEQLALFGDPEVREWLANGDLVLNELGHDGLSNSPGPAYARESFKTADMTAMLMCWASFSEKGTSRLHIAIEALCDRLSLPPTSGFRSHVIL